MKKKGFTLIELLAVIVILAIIALIAVPIVLNIIEKARKGAAKDSALSYMKAVETYIVSSKLDKNGVELKAGEEYSCNDNTIIDSKNYLPLNDLVELKGFKPSGNEDYLKIDEKKNIDEGKLTINGYIIIINGGKITSVSKGEKVDAESMDINYTSQAMEKGSTFKLKAIFTPVDASDQRVTYVSSNENVVTVSETGIVTAVGNGEAKVTVTSKFDSNLKKECNITVTTSATGVNVAPTTAEIKVGKTVQLTGTIEPNDVETNALTWESSDPTIAHVDENGLVTGMEAGTATITAKTSNNKTATSTITVIGGPTKTEPSSTDTHKGIVYLDPTNLNKYCTKELAEANVNSDGTPTEIKTGCMKWYIYNDSGSTYKMILDHNTTARVQWNSSNGNVAYASSNAKAAMDATLANWKVTPSMIGASEISTITGVTGWTNTGSWYYLDSQNKTTPRFSKTIKSKYSWLYNNLHGCLIDSGTWYGCDVDDSDETYLLYGTSNDKNYTYGYWTKDTVGTAGSGSNVWIIYTRNTLDSDFGANDTHVGIRPVIEIPKSTIK